MSIHGVEDLKDNLVSQKSLRSLQLHNMSKSFMESLYSKLKQEHTFHLPLQKMELYMDGVKQKWVSLDLENRERLDIGINWLEGHHDENLRVSKHGPRRDRSSVSL